MLVLVRSLPNACEVRSAHRFCDAMVSEMAKLVRQTGELFSDPVLPQPVECDMSFGHFFVYRAMVFVFIGVEPGAHKAAQMVLGF